MTVKENIRIWNDGYRWSKAGDEWSANFGGTEALWFFVLYPRIHRYLPAGRILEIAPGFGRWTQFLKTQCDSMIAVDISLRCIEQCRERFASDDHIRFDVNDGTSLAAVPDNSVDFVFSFDSLVHAEKDVMEAYLWEISRKLTPDGVGFIHHSNIGTYPRQLALKSLYNRLPLRFRKKILRKERVSSLLDINLDGLRAPSMTGSLFREYCENAGLKCISQELMNWTKGKGMIDALSVFTRPGSRWDKEESLVNNDAFVENAALTSRLAKLYCS